MLFILSLAAAATPEALDKYAHERLLRSSYAIQGGAITLTPTYDPKFAPHAWAVFDGAGKLLTADDFAIDIGDVAMQARFERLDEKAATRRGIATVVAIVAVTAGMTAGASGMPDPPQSMAPPDRRDALWQQLDHARNVSDYYLASYADELIVAHNSGLRRALGLTQEEVAAIEHPTVPSAAPAPAATTTPATP